MHNGLILNKLQIFYLGDMMNMINNLKKNIRKYALVGTLGLFTIISGCDNSNAQMKYYPSIQFNTKEKSEILHAKATLLEKEYTPAKGLHVGSNDKIGSFSTFNYAMPGSSGYATYGSFGFSTNGSYGYSTNNGLGSSFQMIEQALKAMPVEPKYQLAFTLKNDSIVVEGVDSLITAAYHTLEVGQKFDLTYQETYKCTYTKYPSDKTGTLIKRLLVGIDIKDIKPYANINSSNPTNTTATSLISESADKVTLIKKNYVREDDEFDTDIAVYRRGHLFNKSSLDLGPYNNVSRKGEIILLQRDVDAAYKVTLKYKNDTITREGNDILTTKLYHGLDVGQTIDASLLHPKK